MTDQQSDNKLAIFRSLFKGREDVFALHWEISGGKSGYMPAYHFDPYRYRAHKMNKIKNIIGGIVIEGSQDNCPAIRNLLCQSFPTSTTVKKDVESQSIIKEKQIRSLENYCN